MKTRRSERKNFKFEVLISALFIIENKSSLIIEGLYIKLHNQSIIYRNFDKAKMDSNKMKEDFLMKILIFHVTD
jgi:hypothetical protein